MLQLRALDSLGGGNRDWLKARHHFAVEAEGNPAHARLGNLLVWNDASRLRARPESPSQRSSPLKSYL